MFCRKKLPASQMRLHPSIRVRALQSTKAILPEKLVGAEAAGAGAEAEGLGSTGDVLYGGAAAQPAVTEVGEAEPGNLDGEAAAQPAGAEVGAGGLESTGDALNGEAAAQPAEAGAGEPGSTDGVPYEGGEVAQPAAVGVGGPGSTGGALYGGGAAGGRGRGRARKYLIIEELEEVESRNGVYGYELANALLV